MLYEILSHAMVFDLGWFVHFVMGNLLWVFIFACLGQFVYGKGPLMGGAFAAIYLFSTFDFAQALGWVFRSGVIWVPVIVFIAKMGYVAFFGEKGFSGLPFPWFASVAYFGALIYINLVLA